MLNNCKETCSSNWSLRRLMLSGVSVGVLSALASPAYAACTGLDTATVNCSGTDNSGVATTFSGGNVTNTLSDWTVTGGGFTSTASGAGSLNTLTATNSSITNTLTTGDVFGIRVVSTGDVSLATSGGAITTIGDGGQGIFAQSDTGNVTVINAASLETSGTSSPAIEAISNAVSGGAVSVTSTGAITTRGAASNGIMGVSTAGSVDIVNGGTIETFDASYGIFALAQGGPADINVINSGTITTHSDNSIGLAVQKNISSDGFVNVVNSGTITTAGAGSFGMYLLTGTDYSVDNSGTIFARDAPGIVASTSGNDTAFHITNQATGSIFGLYGIAIAVGNNTPTADFTSGLIDNAGTIGASSDQAIRGVVTPLIGPVTINNSGIITGYLQLSTESVHTLNNERNWDLRNFADTTGTFDADGNAVRDTLGVAISDFGTSGSNAVNNNGTIALLGAGDAAVTTLDTTGQYLPLAAGSVTNAVMGNQFNAMAVGGPIQGQILGVQTFNNAGTIDLTANVVGGNAVVGDVLVISGGHTAGADGGGVFLANGGTLKLNTVLNGGDANSQSDMLVVDSTQLGTAPTSIAVTNVGGAGAQTTNNGIALVEVLNKGASANGVFALQGDYPTGDNRQAVVGGAYAYTLEHNGVGADAADGNWYLRSQLVPIVSEPEPEPSPDPEPEPGPRYQAGVPVYEAYPQTLLGLNGLPTLQQRVGNRYWKEAPAPAEPVFCKDPAQNFRCAPTAEQSAAYADSNSGHTVDANGVWGRIEGAHNSIDSGFSTTGVEYRQNVLRLQAGVDGQLMENESGKLIGGVSVHYVHGSTKTSSIYDALNGGGEISTDGYGLGGSLTWYGENGFYLDAQGQVTWYNSDLDYDGGNRSLIGGNDGFGYALSLEGGKRIAIDPAWSITPQAQLTWSSVTFDDFIDTFGAPVSLDRGDSLQGRLGIALNHETSWKNDDGVTDRMNVYGIANLYYEFLDGTRVDVADVSFANRKDRLWGGLGLGGSYNWNDDKYSIYGEGLVDTSLENFGDSYSLKGQAGFRVRF